MESIQNNNGVGQANGFKNGLNGCANGNSNGHMNGSNGAANGHTNGQTNGQTNGHSNGHSEGDKYSRFLEQDFNGSGDGKNDTHLRMETMAKLFHVVSDKQKDTMNKVTVVGTGQVGMAAVFSLLTQNISNNICLVDMDAEKVKGEQMDLLHGASFLKFANVTAGTDYSVTAGSVICVVTAGVRQKQNETRLELAQRNCDVFKIIIPQLIKYSPDTILVLATNPVDICTYAAWKISGLPKSRVIGSGCNLDTARFRYLLAEKLKVAPTSVHGYIIGEHGDSSVPVWSGVHVAGVRLAEINPHIGTDEDSEDFKDVHRQVVESAYNVIRAKGYTSWAIGLSIAEICQSILLNANSIHSVSTSVKGEHGITHDVFLSLPCVIGRNGITDIIRQPLNKQELSKLQDCAGFMHKVQSGITFLVSHLPRTAE